MTKGDGDPPIMRVGGGKEPIPYIESITLLERRERRERERERRDEREGEIKEEKGGWVGGRKP